MKISKIEFTMSEEIDITTLAHKNLHKQGVPAEKWVEITKDLSPQNLLRLALGLEIKKRGREKGDGDGRRMKGQKKAKKGESHDTMESNGSV